MARKIQTRWKIKGTLIAETPIHVGGMGGDADTDLALAINGRGNYYIPGTSLAGALRGWASKPFHNDKPNDDKDQNSLKHPENVVNLLWGFQEQDQGHASFIVIDDAEIIRKEAVIEIREGVGIDRHTGAAADRFKYSRAILPKGITFPLNLTLDCSEHQNPDHIWQLLRTLEEGDIRIGAAKTRGLGKVKLKNLTIHEHQFNADAIFDVLLKNGQEHQWTNLRPEKYDPPDQVTLTISWKPKDPVMVKAEGDGIAVDILPLASSVGSDVRFVIPGSSIKGVLRAHAERIVRTVCLKDTGDNFLQQIHLDLITEIFGAASRGEKELGLIGALSIDDCYAKLAMSLSQWASVENAPKGQGDDFTPVKQALSNALGGNSHPFKTLQPAMHVAVDRWTGGAADGMLYSVLEPIGVDWNPIGIHVDVARLKRHNPNNVQPAIALLLLVLRDFANRKIPIGYGTNRGMGTVEVTEMCMSCSSLEGLTGIEGKTAIASDLSNFNDQVLSDLTTAWQTWIKQHQEAA